MSKCCVCNRPLTNTISIALNIGPDCRETYAQFAAGCGSSLEEIGVIALSANTTAVHWIGLANIALRRGNKRDARYFVEQAKREYESRDFTIEDLVERRAA